MKGDDPDKYLDPKYNPFIPKGEPEVKGSHREDNPFDLTTGRAPFAAPEKDPEKAGAGLNALLDEKFPGGGIVEVGGIKLVRLLGTWARDDGGKIEELPAEEREKIEKAIREKGGV